MIAEKQESNIDYKIDTNEVKKLVGTDIFVNMNVSSAHDIADKISKLDLGNFELKTISSKGLKLWPRDSRFETVSDHWCCRFMNKKDTEIKHLDITRLLGALSKANIDFIKVENLFEFDGVGGYSLAQGE